MGKKKVAARSKLRPFVAVAGYSNLLPTRLVLFLFLFLVALFISVGKAAHVLLVRSEF